MSRLHPGCETGRAHPRAAALLVFLAALAVYGFGASQRDLWRTDEYRYAVVARAMTEPGGSWWVPHLNGAPYAAKPPLYFWAAAALHGGLGLPLPLAAMLPSVLASSLALALTFALGRRLYGPAAGLAAAVVLGSSEMFVNLALRSDLDALLAVCTTGSLYAYWRGEELRDRGEGALRFDLLAGAAAGLGILTKGPVALALPAVVVATHRLLRRGPSGLRDRGLLIAAAVALLPVAAWLGIAAAEADGGFLREVLLGNAVGEALGQRGKNRPFWFYLKDFPGGFLPWVVLLPAALWWGARRRCESDFALAWCVAPLLLFTLFPAKRHNYLLPLYPGAALLVGCLLAEVRGRGGLRAGPGLAAAWSLGTAVLGLAALLLGIGLAAAGGAVLLGWQDLLASLWPPWPLLAPSATRPAATALVIGPAMAVAGGWLVAPGRGPWRASAALALGGLIAIFLVTIFHPLQSAGQSDRGFYAEVDRRVGDQRLATYGGMDFSANLMTGRTVVRMHQTREAAERGASRSELPVWFVTERREVERLGLPACAEVVARQDGSLGPELLLLRCEGGKARGEAAVAAGERSERNRHR